MDIDSKDKLIACKHTIPEIAEIIDADTLGFLPYDDVKKIAEDGDCKGFCLACFDGNYPTIIPKDDGKNKFEQKIDKTKKKSKTKDDTNEEQQ